jgi:hypothetical protein
MSPWRIGWRASHRQRRCGRWRVGCSVKRGPYTNSACVTGIFTSKISSCQARHHFSWTPSSRSTATRRTRVTTSMVPARQASPCRRHTPRIYRTRVESGGTAPPSCLRFMQRSGRLRPWRHRAARATPTWRPATEYHELCSPEISVVCTAACYATRRQARSGKSAMQAARAANGGWRLELLITDARRRTWRVRRCAECRRRVPPFAHPARSCWQRAFETSGQCRGIIARPCQPNPPLSSQATSCA